MLRLATSPGAVHLPRQPTRLIDRTDELARIETMLARQDVRLVTLTGPGGVGKSRLAIEAAEQVQDCFPDGVWFVDLAPLADPELVVPTIARVIGVPERPERDPVAALAGFLTGRAILLVLDNLEHLLAAAPTLDALLAAGPRLTILATSREPLHLRREQVVSILPLTAPDSAAPLESVASAPAVTLFVERAQAADAAFTLTERNVAAVAELSRRLDGLPLALELAAARTRLLPPAALLARMERMLPLLTGGPRDAPARQRTMRDAIAWSHDLLPPAQQALFRRLAVFVGGFTLEGAEAIISAQREVDLAAGAGEGLFYRRPTSPDRPPFGLAALAALVDHSLVQRVAGSDAEQPRYRMLETVREFGLERLDASGEADAARRRHLAYLVALAEQLAEQILLPEAERALARLDAEYDDVRAALRWAEATGESALGLRLARAMINYWRARGRLREGRDWLERALNWGEPIPSPERARVLGGIGWLAHFQGDLDRAERALGEAIGMAAAVGARTTEARAWNALALVQLDHGRRHEAAAAMDRALALFRELEPDLIAGALHLSNAFARRGLIARLTGDLPTAADALAEAERLLRNLGPTWAHSEALRYLGDVARDRGDLAGALRRYQESMEAAWAGVDRLLVADALDGVASVAAARRRPDRAVRLHRAAAVLRERLGAQAPPWERTAHERNLAAAQAALGEAAFAVAWAEGAALPPEAVTAEALADEMTPGPTDDAPAAPDRAPAVGLTVREREVLAVVAEGRSNKQIAEALFISPSTVKSHVASLLNKLDANTRAQLVALAAARGLL